MSGMRLATVSTFTAVVLGALLAPSAQAPAPPPQTPTFRAAIEYVEVDATVVDGAGRFVRDLTQNDFQIFEDGRPQKISGFSLVDLPVAREDRPLYSETPFEPDVVSNERPFDGRVFVLVIDDLHTGFQRSEPARRVAREFIERYLRPNDLMAVVHTVGAAEANQEFTSNKRLLLAAVEHTSGRKLKSAVANKVEDYFVKQRLGVAELPIDQDDAQRAHNALASLRTLEDVSRRMGAMRGRRKAVLLVSEGIDYDVRDVMSIEPTNTQHREVQNVQRAIRDAAAAAARANVLVYGIDPRGTAGLADEDSEIPGFPIDGLKLGLDTSALRNELRMAQDSLQTISFATGGFAVTNTNGFQGAYDRILAENSSYYLLAYYPPSVKRDGRFHSIEVRVSRPGVTVKARPGYVAGADAAPVAPPTHEVFKTAPRELLDALNSLIPVSGGLRLKVSAASFRDAPPNGSILVVTELPAADLQLTPGSSLDLVYIAVDADGRIRAAATDRLALDLRPEVRQRVEQTGVRFLNRLRLPAGRYQVRVAIRQAPGGAVGSLAYDLDVPDYDKLPLSMSGVLLTSGSSAATMTARPDAVLRTALPAPPAATRAFPQSDEIVVFAEIYDTATAPHRVDVTGTIATDTGTIVSKTEQERSSSELAGKAGGYGFTARIPLSGLAPGAYVLRVDARSRLSGNPAVSRQVRFYVTEASLRR